MSPKKSSKKPAKAKPLKAKLPARKTKPKPAPAKAAKRALAKSASRSPAKRARKKTSAKERLKAVKKLISPPKAQKVEITSGRTLGRVEPRPEEGHDLTTRRILDKLRESGIVDEEKPRKVAVERPQDDVEEKPPVKLKKLRLIRAIVPKKQPAQKEERPEETEEETPAEILPQEKEEEPEDKESGLSAEGQEDKRKKKLSEALEGQEEEGQEIPEEKSEEEEIKAVLEATPVEESAAPSEGEEKTEEEPAEEAPEKEEEKEPAVPVAEEIPAEEKETKAQEGQIHSETESSEAVEEKKKEVPFEWGPTEGSPEEASVAHGTDESPEEKRTIDIPRLLKSIAGSAIVSLIVAFALGVFGLSLVTVLLGAGTVFLASSAYFYLLLKHA